MKNQNKNSEPAIRQKFWFWSVVAMVLISVATYLLQPAKVVYEPQSAPKEVYIEKQDFEPKDASAKPELSAQEITEMSLNKAGFSLENGFKVSVKSK